MRRVRSPDVLCHRVVVLDFPIACPDSLVTFAILTDSRPKDRRGDRLDDVVDFHHSEQFDKLFFR